jgi:hypothetical protein
MILSGHAHLYQRFTRTMNGRETPFIVSGSGGFSATEPKPMKAGTTVGDHTLVVAPIVKFGYLTIETDAQTLTATFKTADGSGVKQQDQVTVDLRKGKIIKSVTAPASPASSKPSSNRGSKTPSKTASKSASKAASKRVPKPAAKKKSKAKKRR